jgi:thiol:disulfide interchange protein DsbC
MVTSSLADDAAIKKLAERVFPNHKVDAIRPLGKSGLYEVYINTNILYIDEKAELVMLGTMFDGKTLRNLTQESQTEYLKIDFSKLPLDRAIKRVNGNGKRVIATFEDPNCGYCKRYSRELASLKDATIYTFVYPVVAANSREKAAALWCAPDQDAAWRAWAENDVIPKTNPACKPPIDEILKLGQGMTINVTPTTFLSSGRRLIGYVPMNTLEAEIKAASNRLDKR